jgi:hypothetical protein
MNKKESVIYGKFYKKYVGFSPGINDLDLLPLISYNPTKTDACLIRSLESSSLIHYGPLGVFIVWK